MNKPLIIEYYTDILCVWAWVAQRRIDELNQKLGEKIEFRHYYVDVFGDVATKMNLQWAKKGGYEGFAAHVQKSVASYEEAPVNSKVWNQVRPATSANAHLLIKAVELCCDRKTGIDTALILRKAFFIDAMDLGNLDLVAELLKSNGQDIAKINASINNGMAMAALMHDYQKSKQQNIKGSPTYVIDGGRQVLYGNVGYRVLHANIEELLKNPRDEKSWC